METKKTKIKLKYIPNATTITGGSAEKFPKVAYFFETLLKDTLIKTKHVGRPFRYNEDIVKNRYYGTYGIFMDNFIRKCLSDQYNTEITDLYTEHILKNSDNYISSRYKKLRDSIGEHYEIFKDSNNKAMDIIESVKIVSLSQHIYFGNPIPKSNYLVNEDNLKEIIKYFEKLPYTSVNLNPTLCCDYFKADSDLLFDNKVIYEIKTSKHKSLTHDERMIPLSKFYTAIIHGFGLYKNTGIKIKQFTIYNPLLSTEYSLELNNIDFKLFEQVLSHDVRLYSRTLEILKDK